VARVQEVFASLTSEQIDELAAGGFRIGRAREYL
jgi:hypothetical protein